MHHVAAGRDDDDLQPPCQVTHELLFEKPAPGPRVGRKREAVGLANHKVRSLSVCLELDGGALRRGT
jgi:hypothetical protein